MVSVRVADGPEPPSTSVKRKNPGFVPLVFVEDDPRAIEQLRSALEIDVKEDGGNWMTPGTPTLTLVGEQSGLASVILIGESHLRFHGTDVWDAPLRDPAALARWLDARMPRPL